MQWILPDNFAEIALLFPKLGVPRAVMNTLRQFICAVIATATLAASASPNLVKNPSLEDVQDGKNMAQHWRGWAPFDGPQFGMDSIIVHSGTHSGTIVTTGDQVAMFVTEWIPVAPGERTHLSCWCRTQDMHTSSGGGIVLTGEFVDRYGSYFKGEHTRVPVPQKQGEWFQVQGDYLAPERAAYVVVEPSVRMATGKFWVDDVEMTTSHSAAIRFDVTSTKFEPGTIELPMVLINRGGAREFTIETQPGGQKSNVAAGARPETPISLPFTFAARGETTASAWILQKQPGQSDFVTTIAGTVPAGIVTEPVIPTHWVVEDSATPRFDARFWVHESEQVRRDLSARALLLDSAGKQLAEKRIGPVTTTTIQFSMEATQRIAEPTTLTVRLLLEQGTSETARAELPWRFIHREDATVSLNSDGFPVVHGKPIFPIGFYMAGHWNELRASGFNVVQNYDEFAVEKGQEPRNADILKFLDRAQDYGMKALVFVNHGLSMRLGREESLRRIRMFRNHPAALVWYEEEAVVRGIKPLSWLQELVGDIRREGPGHPVLIGDQNDEGAKVKNRGNSLPVDLMDVGEWWWYPTPPHDAPAVEDYEGEKAGPNLEYVPPAFLRNRKTPKPLWVAMQCYRKPEADGRYPTPEEYRCQAYIAIIHGAKGLFYYCGYDEDGGGIFLHPKEGHWDYLKKLVAELRGLDNVFMAPDAPQQASSDDPIISIRLKQVGNKYVLLAVNRCKAPQHATFYVPELTGSEELYEHFEKKTITADMAHHFSAEFPGYGAHVYEFAAGY